MAHPHRFRISAQQRVTKRLFRSIFVLVLLVSQMVVAQAIGEEAKSAEKPAITKTLYAKSNQELLDQALGSLNKAEAHYLAHLRGLSQTAFLLDKAKEEAAKPTTNKEDSNRPSHVAPKALLDEAKAHLQAAKALSVKLAKEKSALDKHLAQLKKTDSAARNMADVIKGLEMALFEIQLRVKDGTLRKPAIPKALGETRLKAMLGQVAKRQQLLERETSEANAGLVEIQKKIEQAKKDGLEAQAKATVAKANYERELKRKEREQLYQNYPPSRLLSELTELQSELASLSGDFGIADARFLSSKEQVDQLRNQLDAAEVPAEDLLQRQASTAEAEKFMAEMKAFEQFHQSRQNTLNQLKTALHKLVGHGEALQGEAAVLSEHLSNMRVLSNLLATQAQTPDAAIKEVPKYLAPEAILASSNEISERASNAKAATKKAQSTLVWITKELELSSTGIKLSKDRQAQLEKAISAAQNTRQWDAELKALSAQEIAAQFKLIGEELTTSKAQLEKGRDDTQQAEELADNVAHKLSTLQGTLYRQAQEIIAQQRPTVARDLYLQTELALPKYLEEEGQKAAADDAKPAKKANIDISSYPDNNVRYQNVLSSRIRAVEDTQEMRKEWKGALQSLEQKLHGQHTSLSKTIENALKHYAMALELKKRIGRKELQPHEIPEGITDALKRDAADQLEAEFTKIAAKQGQTQSKIETSDKPDEGEATLLELLGNLSAIVGTRLDLIQDVAKLNQDIQKDISQLSEGERKSLEQVAARRMQAESTTMEKFLAFVPSEAADKLSDILQIYYQETIDLGRSQGLLNQKKDKLDELVASLKQEQGVIGDIIPVLQALIKSKKSQLDEKEVLAKATLTPEKAGELLKSYEARTGKHLIPPAHLTNGQLGHFIEQQANTVVSLKTSALSNQTWISLLQARFSHLMKEDGRYQDDLGELKSQASGITRRIEALTGIKLASENQESAESTKAINTPAMEDMHLAGEIGKLRESRHAIRSNLAIWLLARIALIVLVAWLAIFALNKIFAKLAAKMENSTGQQGSGQQTLALSFGSVGAKTVVWITAIIMVLSNLGFNIGAILAGLGIGGLALAMAAKETLSNLLGAITLFIEKPFVLGDSVKIGNGSTAKVTSITWRTTRLTTGFGYNICVPNSTAAESIITNYSHTFPPGDYVTVYVSAEYDPQVVIPVIDKALEACPLIRHDAAKGTWLKGQEKLGNMAVVGYWPWWSIEDYQKRGGARNQVWQSIWKHLSEAGIRVEINPYDERLENTDKKHLLSDYASDNG